MAEIQEKDKGGKKAGKQKKMDVHLDFTPMVDMNMLLITFFMLCTSLSKPQTMEISMPTNDKVTEEEQTKVQASRAITLLLGDQNEIYYYTGEPDYENYASLIPSSYNADGLRALLLQRNASVVTQMRELKKEKLDLKITDGQFAERSAEIKKDKSSPVVIIKATDKSSYKNLIDALDEMQICNISKYAIVEITDGDKFLLENYKTRGELSGQIDHSKTN